MDTEFNDGQFIGGEFYFRSRTEKRPQTKEEALYGYEESDSDAEDTTASKRRRRDHSRKPDLTKPVSFVSTGSVLPSEEDQQQLAQDEQQLEDGPVGFRPGSQQQDSQLQVGDSQEEDDLLPSAFGKRIKEAAERRGREREIAKLASKAKAAAAVNTAPDSDIAQFEKHTRGIGMKLLAQMGYKGGGLGKNEQGRAKPVEAKLRPKNMGMGFNDFKEVDAGLQTPPSVDEVQESKVKVKERQWSKKNQGKKRPYVTASQLLMQKQEKGLDTVQTVLDMRGPKIRLLTNLGNLNAEHSTTDDCTAMPELQHNLRLIVDLAEADISVCDRKLRHEKDNVILLEKERVRLEADANQQRKQICAMEAIMAAIDQIQQSVNAGGMTLEALALAFQDLQLKCKEDYKLYNVRIVALAAVLPRMIEHFRGWEPLKEPLHGSDVISSCRRLLQGCDPREVSTFSDSDMPGSVCATATNPYGHLVTEAVLPPVRRAVLNQWEPRDPEPMLRFLEVWEKLLPPYSLQDVLDNLVMPKLTAAVDAWDPRLETVPIHAWLHPWLPLLGPKMDPLYLPIRFKLGNALQAWHPSDTSAFALLHPWQTVFDPASWEQLLIRSIFPKLMYALQELVINPAHQQLNQFNWVMAWASAIPMHHMAGMLEAGFFPKWQLALYHWLCSNPNFDEVTQWYLGWKSLLPPELLANERIRRQLNTGLDMMNQAVVGAPVAQPGVRENLSHLRESEQQQFKAHLQKQHAPGTASARQRAAGLDQLGVPDMSLKEVVEAFAQDNDVQFVPKVGRTHEGLQVYSFGAVSACVDSSNQTVLAQVGDRWTPIALEQLMEMHRSRTGGGRWQ